MIKCDSCNKSRGLTLRTWQSTYKRQNGTVVPVKRQLCSGCYEKQEKLSKASYV